MSRPLASRALLTLSLVLATAFTACDKVPLLAPTQSVITLSINTTTLPVNGSAEIVATVTESAGTPVQNGTTVTFTSSVGVVEPREARTEGGIARVTFRAGSQSGTARIGAFSGATRATEVEILVGGAAAQTVTVRAEPSTVPPTGGTVQVIAIVTDVAGNRLPGAPVVFSSDTGLLGSNSGATDSTGEARTTLTTSRQAIVRANVAGKEGQATITVTDLPSVTVSVSPATPLVGLPTVFTVTPGSAANGNPVRSVTLDFGDGTPPASLGTITSATPVSHVYNRADTYTVTATITDSAGQRTINSIIVVVQRPIVNVSFTTAPANGQVGTALTYTVSVSNSSNVPIQNVTLNFGDGSAPSTLGPTGGTVSKIFTRSGTFVVTATAFDQSGSAYSAQVTTIIVPPTAFNVTLTATSGDPAVVLDCTPGTVFPKTCTASFIGIGVRALFTAGCDSGFGAGACSSAISYVWNYGDGTPSETTSQASVDHVFRTRGEFIITVTVTTSTGGVGTQRLTLLIN